MLAFWILRLVDICTPGTAFPCTVGARVRQYYHLYMHYIYTHVCTGKNQVFAVAEGYFANRKMASCLVPVLIKMVIVKA